MATGFLPQKDGITVSRIFGVVARGFAETAVRAASPASAQASGQS